VKSVSKSRIRKGLDPNCRRVLTAIRTEVARLRAIDPHKPPHKDWPRQERGRLWREIEDARDNVVAVDWYRLLGRMPDDSEQRTLRRVLERLERAGYLLRLRLRGGYYTTHVQLTGGRGDG
jgi:hypothetical protein